MEGRGGAPVAAVVVVAAAALVVVVEAAVLLVAVLVTAAAAAAAAVPASTLVLITDADPVKSIVVAGWFTFELALDVVAAVDGDTLGVLPAEVSWVCSRQGEGLCAVSVLSLSVWGLSAPADKACR